MKQFYPHVNRDIILRRILPDKSRYNVKNDSHSSSSIDSHSSDDNEAPTMISQLQEVASDDSEASAMISQLQEVASELENAAKCNYIYAICDISFDYGYTSPAMPSNSAPSNSAQSYESLHDDSANNSDSESCNAPLTLTYKGQSILLLGDDIRRLLKGCQQCIILAATLGPQPDRLMKRKGLQDMGSALIFDMCAGDAIENLCNDINNELDEYYHSLGLFLTDRFSPGYGDLPLSASVDIAKMLDATRRIGLTFNSSGLMIPLKSVTALIGISDKPKPMTIRGCKYCRMTKSCSFKKRGLTCYGSSLDL